MPIKHSLYAKIAIAFLCLITLLGATLLYLSQKMSTEYSHEIMQRINQPVAMYVAGQQPIITNGSVNEQVVDELASRAMIINPSLEIYILDTAGNILSHRHPEGSVKRASIELNAIDNYLSDSAQMPIFGDDPKLSSEQKVFSAAPITENENMVGYVYAVIGGQAYQDLKNAVMESHTLRVGGLLSLAAVLIAAISGCLLFFLFTKRLLNLKQQVDHFGMSQRGKTAYQPNQPFKDRSPPIPFLSTLSKEQAFSEAGSGDEIDELEKTFFHMAEHINQQFEALQSMDETRRELIANVSHDLRTPLASMQGYIETLIIKNDSLNDEQRRHYLEIAHKHSQRLSRLVSELFELAKLEAKGVEPKMEPFSLLELIYDSVQEFQLTAQTKNIQLDITQTEDCFVKADIALIHRVLQNLLDNALTHTPQGGRVKINLVRNNHSAVVEVSDTGKGIETEDIPYIFDRFYKSQQQEPSDKIGTGLGLAIVKRILDLHESKVSVNSQVNKGTCFMFELPQYS